MDIVRVMTINNRDSDCWNARRSKISAGVVSKWFADVVMFCWRQGGVRKRQEVKNAEEEAVCR